MISTADALRRLCAIRAPLSTQEIPLSQAAGRVLASPAAAMYDLPPFAASKMDGYALNGIEADPEAMFNIIGQSAAGHGFSGRVGAGECVRIFTGAPLPAGTNRVIKQEQATQAGNLVTLAREIDPRPFVRPIGADFRAGDSLAAPRVLAPGDLALLASMNLAKVTVSRRPDVAIIPTGDELVMPGERPNADQIIGSNAFGLRALVDAAGGRARCLPIARDTAASLQMAFELAGDADIILTTGGAAFGDYDIIHDVAQSIGFDTEFSGVNIRPGGQTIAGSRQNTTLLALPGSPHAVTLCAHVFVIPLIHYLLGLGESPAKVETATLSAPLPAAGPHEIYLSAIQTGTQISPIDKRKMSTLESHIKTNALIRRPAHDPARKAGADVQYIPILGA